MSILIALRRRRLPTISHSMLVRFVEFCSPTYEQYLVNHRRQRNLFVHCSHPRIQPFLGTLGYHPSEKNMLLVSLLDHNNQTVCLTKNTRWLESLHSLGLCRKSERKNHGGIPSVPSPIRCVLGTPPVLTCLHLTQ